LPHPRHTPSPLPLSLYYSRPPRDLHSFPTRRSSDLAAPADSADASGSSGSSGANSAMRPSRESTPVRMSTSSAHCRCSVFFRTRSEEHTSELQSRGHLVCRLLLEKKKKHKLRRTTTM